MTAPRPLRDLLAAVLAHIDDVSSDAHAAWCSVRNVPYDPCDCGWTALVTDCERALAAEPPDVGARLGEIAARIVSDVCSGDLCGLRFAAIRRALDEARALPAREE